MDKLTCNGVKGLGANLSGMTMHEGRRNILNIHATKYK